MELRDSLQLEGGDFADGDVAGAHLQDRLRVGRANVAHHPGAAAGVFEDLAQEGRSGGLAVGAGHGQQKPGGFAVGVFQFAHHLHAQFAGADNGGMRIGDAGAENERVHALEQRQRVFLAQMPVNARHVEVIQRAFERFARLLIADGHFAATREQEPRRGRAAARHAQHQRFSNLHKLLLFVRMYPRKGTAPEGSSPFARHALGRKAQQCQQAQQHCADIVHGDHARLGHAAQFKVVVQRRHAEDALAVRGFEVGHLNDVRQAGDEHRKGR